MCWRDEMAAAVETNCPLSVFMLQCLQVLGHNMMEWEAKSHMVGPVSHAGRGLELHMIMWHLSLTWLLLIGLRPVKKCPFFPRVGLHKNNMLLLSSVVAFVWKWQHCRDNGLSTMAGMARQK